MVEVGGGFALRADGNGTVDDIVLALVAGGACLRSDVDWDVMTSQMHKVDDQLTLNVHCSTIWCGSGSPFFTLVVDLAAAVTGGRALAREDAVGFMRAELPLVRGLVTGVFARRFVSVLPVFWGRMGVM